MGVLVYAFSALKRTYFLSNCIPKGWATSTTDHSSPVDPAETEAIKYLQLGTQKLEEGDVEGAKAMYKRSVEIKRDAGSLFNLGVTHYHLSKSFATEYLRLCLCRNMTEIYKFRA